MKFDDIIERYILISVKEEGTSFNIEDVVLHPSYIGQAYDDVAVIKLKSSESKLSSEEIAFFNCFNPG